MASRQASLFVALLVACCVVESGAADTGAARGLLQEKEKVYECEHGYTFLEGECVQIIEEIVEEHPVHTTCIECTEHCLECDCSTGHCNGCNPGYLYEGGYCKEVVYVEEKTACHACVDHCFECSCDGHCNACNRGYVYESGYCNAAVVVPTNCGDDDDDGCPEHCDTCRCGVCVECKGDRVLYDGFCVKFPKNDNDDDDDDSDK